MRSSLLTRHWEGAHRPSLSENQIELDAVMHRLSEEARNPVAIASMTLGSLAFQASRSAFVRILSAQNPFVRSSFSNLGALATEVSVFRASRNYFQNLQGIPLTSHDATFHAQSWLATALDLGLLKLGGHVFRHQTLLLRHGSQDLALVGAHELTARLHWTEKEEGSFLQKLLNAEVMNWSLMAGSSFAHHLTGGRLQHFEARLRLKADAYAFNGNRPFASSPVNFLPQLRSSDKVSVVPAALKILTSDTAAAWAERSLKFSGESPENALTTLHHLHEMLSTAQHRDFAKAGIEAMARFTQDFSEGSNILVRRYEIEGLSQALLLLSPPQTFLPEAWSKTFAQGLAQDHQRNPQSRELAIEVGSGTGFISIAMSKLGMARRIIASDRNPHALLVGKLNALLNGVDNIEFQIGDLLLDLAPNLKADLIVGCLPQMPSEKTTGNIAPRDLADYAETRGTFEDQIGLGLNAALIDQARDRLSTQGKLRLMMAQRPGLAIVRDLFVTRGFSPRFVYSRFIQQDAGTDFSALAKIEHEGAFEFEFNTADYRRINAAQASGLPRNAVFHHLHLVEATPHEAPLRVALHELAAARPRWKYTPDAGSEHEGLRASLADHLQKTWGVYIDPQNLFLAPQAPSLLEGIRNIVVLPGERIALFGDLGKLRSSALGLGATHEVFELAPTLTEAASQLAQEKPRLVILRIARQLIANRHALENFLQAAVQNQCWMIFIEEHGALIDPHGKSLVRSLYRFPQAMAQSVVLHPLDTSFAFPQLPLSAALVFNSTLRQTLAHYGEVTYSRASTAIQALYDRFLRQPEVARAFYWGDLSDPGDTTSFRGRDFPFSPLAQRLSSAQAFRNSPQAFHRDPIDMSFGESEWRPPLPLEEVFLKALEGNRFEEARTASVDYLARERGIRFTPDQVTLGAGVQNLVYESVRAIAGLHPLQAVDVFLPSPGYALFKPTVLAAGARARPLRTRFSKRFLLEGDAMEASVPPNTQRVLLLNLPSNPGGQYYSRGTLRKLTQASDYVLQDEVFAGTNFGISQWRTPALKAPLAERRIILGGISKEFALGGLRFAFAASENAAFNAALQAQTRLLPDALALESALAILPQSQALLASHRRYLKTKAQQLADFFRKHKIDFHPAQGGFSLFVNLSPLLNGRYRLDETVLTQGNFHEVLMREAGIRVHSHQWGGIPGHFRFVFSIDRLPEAIQRLDVFFSTLRSF